MSSYCSSRFYCRVGAINWTTPKAWSTALLLLMFQVSLTDFYHRFTLLNPAMLCKKILVLSPFKGLLLLLLLFRLPPYYKTSDKGRVGDSMDMGKFHVPKLDKIDISHYRIISLKKIQNVRWRPSRLAVLGKM